MHRAVMAEPCPQQKVPSSASEVFLHIYHCDPYTGFLNRMLLRDQQIGIYHAGVEVYGNEWSFQYYEDAWEKPFISGVIKCQPKHMGEYEYQESVSLGFSPLTQAEVDKIVIASRRSWPANSYHITRHNCLSFAEHLVKMLQTPDPFPSWLKGILDASKESPSIDAVVDYSWSWMKWYMVRKHQEAGEGLCSVSIANKARRRSEEDARQNSARCSNAAQKGGSALGKREAPSASAARKRSDDGSESCYAI
mmetsp:Transcript_21168/g.46683  ORF Transcript_21168/g.46683 Transcript_21168/m.46683 type:complete len:250 (+) Transcript_21168:36-785(+)